MMNGRKLLSECLKIVNNKNDMDVKLVTIAGYNSQWCKKRHRHRRCLWLVFVNGGHWIAIFELTTTNHIVFLDALARDPITYYKLKLSSLANNEHIVIHRLPTVCLQRGLTRRSCGLYLLHFVSFIITGTASSLGEMSLSKFKKYEDYNGHVQLEPASFTIITGR